MSHLEKYSKCPYVNGFYFPNSEVRNKDRLDAAFAQHGMSIADIQYEMYAMWVWVLTTEGNLYLLDKSHGGGGCFAKQ
jgi:hypothetical protein